MVEPSKEVSDNDKSDNNEGVYSRGKNFGGYKADNQRETAVPRRNDGIHQQESERILEEIVALESELGRIFR